MTPDRGFWRMDKLRAIKFFCRVVEAKSFVAAAYDLDVVPSVLSKSIVSLEAEIKFRLFNRTTRRVSLTENGARYYDRCKRLVEELEEAEVTTRDGVMRPAGKLLVGLHPGISRAIMSKIDKFISDCPDIAIETTLISTTSTLIEDKLDVLITLGDFPDSTYVIQKLGVTKPIIVAAPRYLEANGSPRVPEDLAKHVIVLSGRRDSSAYARWTLTKGKKTESVFVSARIVNREGVHIHEACLSGAGICRLIEISTREPVERGALQILLPDWSFSSLPISAVYPSRKNIPAKVSAFIDFVRLIIRN